MSDINYGAFLLDVDYRAAAREVSLRFQCRCLASGVPCESCRVDARAIVDAALADGNTE